uniref:Uncharacterized protein n=1 Tax=Anguilla anguilla TaxID=7936 RepID=A0A0E9QIE3_ANGAN
MRLHLHRTKTENSLFTEPWRGTDRCSVLEKHSTEAGPHEMCGGATRKQVSVDRSLQCT